MSYFKLVFFLISLSSPFLWAAIAELPPIGFAQYRDLGQEQFVVSVNAETYRLINEERFSLQGRQQINLKVTAEQIYPRKLLRFFIQGAAVNNSEDELINNSKHMEAFASAVKGKLVKGDHLAFTFNGESETLVSINDVELLKIESDEFFAVVLNSFTGSVPPSRDFKKAVLGIEESSEARTIYAILDYDPSRKLAVSNWRSSPEELSSERELSYEQQGGREELESAQLDQSEESPQSDPAGLQERNNSIELADEPRANESGSSSPKAIEPVAVAQRNAGTGSRLLARPEEESNLKRVKLAMSATRSGVSYPEIKNDADRLPLMTAESILKSQFFAKDLLGLSRQSIAYPRRAQALKQTGNVLASVTIDRKGRIKNVVLVNESRYSALNKAVLKGIKKAQPFPPIPSEIHGAEFNFVVPVTFALR